MLIFILPLVLLSCGPTQDKSGDAERERVADLENLFNQAYQDLDVAIMDRLLSEDFEAVYPTQQGTKDKEQWLGELQGFRAVFPALDVSVDSTEFSTAEQGVSVTAVRKFSWTQDGQSGVHRERYTNRWTKRSGEWRISQSSIVPQP